MLTKMIASHEITVLHGPQITTRFGTYQKNRMIIPVPFYLTSQCNKHSLTTYLQQTLKLPESKENKPTFFYRNGQLTFVKFSHPAQ